ncbi:MAG: hypothetical protein GEU82_01425 [Luteitalea sp.]|nr:hypothetical protein [Luteitalea sp.]
MPFMRAHPRPRRRQTVSLLTVGLLVVAGCRARTLPPAPTAITSGMVIYTDINYHGASAHITADIADLRAFTSTCREVDTHDDPEFTAGSETWSNCLSSLGVAPGWRAILYSDPRFSGERFEVAASLRDLRRVPGPCRGTFNDCVSSIQIVAPAQP